MIFVLVILFTIVNVAEPDCDFKKYQLKSSVKIPPEFIDKIHSCSKAVQTVGELNELNSTIELYGSNHWADLLFSRIGRMNLNWGNEEEVNQQLNLKICDRHREALMDNFTGKNSLYITVSQRGNPRKEVKLCGFPHHIQTTVKSHNEKVPVARKSLLKEHSIAIAEDKGYLLPPGLPLCNRHHIWVQKILRKQSKDIDENMNDLIDADDKHDKSYKDRRPSWISQSGMDPEVCKKFDSFASALNRKRVKTPREYENLQPDTKRKKISDGAHIFYTISKIMAPGSEGEFRYHICRKTALSEHDILPPRLHEKMDELVILYLQEQNKYLKKKYLSLMTVAVSFEELQYYITGISRREYNNARNFTKIMENPNSGPPQTRVRFDKEKILAWVRYLTSPAVVTKLPWGMKSAELSDGEKILLPNIVRELQGAEIIRMYKEEMIAQGKKDMILSDASLWRLLRLAAATTAKNLRGVDSFIALGRDAFDELKSQVRKWEKDGYLSSEEAATVEHHLLESQQYLETNFKSLLVENTGSASHCIMNALSDPNNEAFQVRSDHNHTFVFHRDIKLNNVLNTIEIKAEEIWRNLEDTNGPDNLETKSASRRLHIIQENLEYIEKMRKHILRAVYSEKTREKLTDNLYDGEALVTADWAQKYEPIYHRERQDQYFGKRGTPWHITHVLAKISGKFVQHTFVHVTPGEIQNTATVVALLIDVLKDLKYWNITTVTLRSDNAGCYHSSQMFGSIPKIMEETGVKIKEYVFSEAQAGKSSCDREAARIKHKIRQTAKRMNVVTPEEMVAAMSEKGNMTFLTMKIVELSNVQHRSTTRSTVRGDRIKNKSKKASIPHIRDYGYWKIEQNETKLFRYYGIGNGQPQKYTQGLLDLYQKKNLEINGTIFPKITNMDIFRESELERILQNNEPTFWRISMVNHLSELRESGHIDTDTPIRKEPRTISDCFLHMYKGCLDDVISQHGSMSAANVWLSAAKEQATENEHIDRFPEGWGIPSRSGRSFRWTEEAKQFLIGLFNKGVSNPQRKVTAEQARKLMEEDVDKDGIYTFELNNIPAVTTISSFFSAENRRHKEAAATQQSTTTATTTTTTVTPIQIDLEEMTDDDDEYDDDYEHELNAQLQMDDDELTEDIFFDLKDREDI